MRQFIPRPLTALLLLNLFLLMPLTLYGQQIESPEETWQEEVKKKLNLMGHRNWVLVVDKAFPEQSSPGMTYLYVDQDLIPTLKEVLNMMAAGGHVRPVIYRDLELNYLTDNKVPGIESFRAKSDSLLSGTPIQSMLHEQVFSLLDESSSLFTTLVIKTSCTLPYTSVFLQLDCAYWGPEDEKALRERMEQSPEN